VTLTAEQRTRIQQTVLAGNNVPRVNNVNFSLNVGVAVPRSVRVVEVPSALIEIYPQWRGHQYFVVNDEIVIVDRSRRIVTRLPMSSSGGGAAQLDRGDGARTGSAGELVDLGPDQIRQVQIVLREKGFYRGEPDGVLGSATTQALIVFQRKQGLQASGRIDTRTVTALGMSNLSGQQGNRNQPATTGQDGNATQQAPANENTGRGGQPSAGQNENAMPENSNATQQQRPGQPPANQDVGAGQQNNSSGNQPSTTGQGGDRSEQPAARQGSGNDTSGQPSDRKLQQGNPNGASR
jgi:peptidoglycan hydrolase-like protein with peptidoglycan-binding domain